MNSSPSIGSVGVTVDSVNRRVKVLHTKVFSSLGQVEACLREDVAGSNEAAKLLSHPTARFTARVIGEKLNPVPLFVLPCGISVQEEARIHVRSLDVVYVGGNTCERMNARGLASEKQLSLEAMRWSPKVITPEVSFERLIYPIAPKDVSQLIEMFQLCFTSYLVLLDETLVQGAATNSIFFVARDGKGRIVASAIGESLRVGPLTLLEISEEAAHPQLRIRGAASGCARRVIEEGKRALQPPVVAFWEARMWRNVLGMGQAVGLTQFGGVLHQHCRIASPPEFTSLPQTEFGSLAVFYAP